MRLKETERENRYKQIIALAFISLAIVFILEKSGEIDPLQTVLSGPLPTPTTAGTLR